MIKNVAIIGSCQSRDIFNHNFVDNYKKYFKVQSYFTMTSMLSVMGEPLKYNFNKLVTAEMNDNQMKHWYDEFEKPVLKVLESTQPDVLLLDFYADARYGARFYDGDYVVDRLAKVRNKDIIPWNKFGIVYNYQQNTEGFLTMWKNRFDRFMDFVNDKLADTVVVINTIKGTNIVEDKDGNKYYSPKVENIDVNEINKIWEYMDEYAIRKYQLKALRFEKEYLLDPDYLFGLGVALVHFHKDYYMDCFNKLIEATKDYEQEEKRESHCNLVVDSAFANGIDAWTTCKGKFEIINHLGYNGIKFIDCRKSLGKYRPQIWSKPLEIDGDGETEYTLSFYINVENPDLLSDDEVVFGIRTFNKLKEIRSDDALSEERLTLDKRKIRPNKEHRYVYTFKPKGKFIRLAPFMFRFKEGIEYNRIKLERATEVSDYTK